MVKQITRRFLDVLLVVAAVVVILFVLQRDGASSTNLSDVMVVVMGAGALLACSGNVRRLENRPAKALRKMQREAEMGGVQAE